MRSPSRIQLLARRWRTAGRRAAPSGQTQKPEWASSVMASAISASVTAMAVPTFLVGVTESIEGPNDQTPMPHYRVGGHAQLAAHVRASGLARGFDLSLSQDFSVDHSIMVPLHFLTPRMQIPIVPVFINGLCPPLPG